MKNAVYSGTRNLYADMVTAAKSLVANSSVDRIYFLIEDDEFPVELPDIITCMNVSGQGFFPKGGVNMKTQFTYMAMLRVCYTRLLPDVNKGLQLDVDTICVDDVDALWEVNMKDSWVAMVEEKLSTYKPYGPLYYNAGVAVFDLEVMRRTRVDEELIRFLNTVKVPYVDQDAVNRIAGRVIDLDPRYNESFVTAYTETPAIVHFAGHKNWQNSARVPRREYIRKYREMSWDEVMSLHEERVKSNENSDSSTNV